MTDLIEKALNTAIDHFKKSPVLNTAVATADATMDRINAFLQRDPITLDDLVAKLSQGTDDLILMTQSNEGLTYVGGELNVLAPVPQASTFEMVLKLYFQGENEKVILKESRKELAANTLTEESIQELAAKKKISFEVDPPAQAC